MKAVHLLSFMCLMYCIVSEIKAGTTGVGTRRRVKRELVVPSLPSVDDISKGVDLVRGWIDEHMATANVSIENYTKWRVQIYDMELIDGNVDDQTALIPAGYSSQWFAYELPEHNGTEGFAPLNIGSNVHCVVYWRAEHQLAGRKKNALAVGCMPTSYKCKSRLCVDDWESEIEKSLEDSSYISDYLYFQEYHTTLPVIEHCNELVCIQGKMGVKHKTKVPIQIFPRNVTNVAPSLKDTLTQEIIDDSIDENNFIEAGKPKKPRKKDTLGGGAIAGIVVGSVVVLIAITSIIVLSFQKLLMNIAAE